MKCSLFKFERPLVPSYWILMSGLLFLWLIFLVVIWGGGGGGSLYIYIYKEMSVCTFVPSFWPNLWVDFSETWHDDRL